jgi:hypothetical protein
MEDGFINPPEEIVRFREWGFAIQVGDENRL